MKSAIGKLEAIFSSFFGRDLDYYPRENGQVIVVDTLLRRINEELDGVALPEDKFEVFLARARESLDEVKALTEYQDQKVSRLLTIVAFLTAAAGTVFSKILDVYPLRSWLRSDAIWESFSVICLYALFALFMLLVALGAMVSFHAIQTRFLWAETQSPDATKETVKSFLFFQSILTTKPEAWARAFLDGADGKKPNPSLSTEYYKNYIAESYLIAAKIGDKLRYLDPAQGLLLYSIRVLVGWLIALSVVVVLVPTSKDLELAVLKKGNSPKLDFSSVGATSNPNGSPSTSNITVNCAPLAALQAKSQQNTTINSTQNEGDLSLSPSYTKSTEVKSDPKKADCPR